MLLCHTTHFFFVCDYINICNYQMGNLKLIYSLISYIISRVERPLKIHVLH